MGKLPLRARLATTVAGAAGRMSRLSGRGDGSVIGGAVGLRMEPDLLRLASALGRAPDAPFGVLEVDERYLPVMIETTRPRVVTLLNLSRDQMDRAAEIWLVARRWREALANADGCRVVANADDPLIAWAAAAARRVTWVAAGQRWHEDSWCCPECGSHLRRDDLGWRCGECSFARPATRWALDDAAADLRGGAGVKGSVVDSAGRFRELSLRLPGRANRSNAVIALAVAELFGVDMDQALPLLREVSSVAGRYTQIERGGRLLRLLLAKNPAGWLEAFDVLAPAPAPVLLAVNAQGPDGRDTSWLWDVDYRVLRGRPVLVAGERRLDLAVRLEADQVAFELAGGVDDAVDRVPPGGLDVIANYTAFQQIRTTLGRAQ